MESRLKRKSKYFLGGQSLQAKVASDGGPTGNALQKKSTNDNGSSSLVNRDSLGGIYGSRRVPKMNRKTYSITPKERVPVTKGSLSSTKSVSSASISRFSRGSHRTVLDPHAGEADVHIVCAISENLARETCVASMDAGSPISMHVTKQGNGQTYAETLAYLEALRPDEVLLNEGRRNSQLARKVLELYHQSIDNLELPTTVAQKKQRRRDQEDENELRYGPLEGSVVVKFVSRACFDQTKGATLLQKIAREETYDASMVEEYILLSSAHALLHYVQQCLGVTFLKNSLHLNINSGGNNRMTIDRSTLLQLELLVNIKTGKVKNSLIGTIDCTKTTVGSRLLRTNLMSPPARVDTINTRLELVDLFLSNADFFYNVMDYLNQLPDIDKMLSNVVLVPRKAVRRGENSSESIVVNERLASKGISALVYIKSTLQVLPSFAKVLQDHLKAIKSHNAANNPKDDTTIATDRTSLLVGLGGGMNQVHLFRHHLLRAIIFAMTQPDLSTILTTVTDLLTESTTFSRNVNAMRHQECFALKCEEDGMMSVFRKAFLANVDDIYKLADEYAEVYGFTVSVRYTTSRGYYLTIPVEIAKELPPVFMQPTKSGRFILCTTEKISSLNTRAQDNVHDLLLMTHDRIQEALNVARTHYDAIATLCDSIALLDMCHSFADSVLTHSTMQWCRPVVCERNTGADDSNTASIQSTPNTGGMMVIRKGRYPIDITDSVTCVDGPLEYIPNDVFASDEKTFTVITGINGSGKSTYLKQIAIITILAHCGSYVSAESAKIPIRDRVCCRIGNTDDQEHNISTFLLEMKETAFICNNATDRSLVLIDELGRATSNEDGVAIAWSVSEYLLKKRAMTFFVTHYPQLSSLATIYPIVQNIHLQASVSNELDGGEISYTHKAMAGPCSVSTDYGVKLALECGWPIEVVENASRIQEVVIGLLPEEGLCHPRPLQPLSDTRTKAFSVLGRLSHELQGLISDGKLHSNESIRSNLIQMQERYARSIDNDLMKAMGQLLRPDDPENRNKVQTKTSSANAITVTDFSHMDQRETTSNVIVTEDATWNLDNSGYGHQSEEDSTSSDSETSTSSDSSDDSI